MTPGRPIDVVRREQSRRITVLQRKLNRDIAEFGHALRGGRKSRPTATLGQIETQQMRRFAERQTGIDAARIRLQELK